ncbi:hypothetical protein V1478_001983 [Vespula squamosa]|uniref:Uncharacterized protein n=1 Tax=Vespula squamosa TaxID=30214 RepID=A0ABD2BYN8_VESSQ
MTSRTGGHFGSAGLDKRLECVVVVMVNIGEGVTTTHDNDDDFFQEGLLILAVVLDFTGLQALKRYKDKRYSG